ncbi:hypothetical protein V8E54_012554 [Elaphomyces granulatus]
MPGVVDYLPRDIRTFTLVAGNSVSAYRLTAGIPYTARRPETAGKIHEVRASVCISGDSLGLFWTSSLLGTGMLATQPINQAQDPPRHLQLGRAIERVMGIQNRDGVKPDWGVTENALGVEKLDKNVTSALPFVDEATQHIETRLSKASIAGSPKGFLDTSRTFWDDPLQEYEQRVTESHGHARRRLAVFQSRVRELNDTATNVKDTLISLTESMTRATLESRHDDRHKADESASLFDSCFPPFHLRGCVLHYTHVQAARSTRRAMKPWLPSGVWCVVSVTASACGTTPCLHRHHCRGRNHSHDYWHIHWHTLVGLHPLCRRRKIVPDKVKDLQAAKGLQLEAKLQREDKLQQEDQVKANSAASAAQMVGQNQVHRAPI